MSNREIAETLFVTRKTVELHLGNTFGKLGIRSRTQLAGILGGADPAGTGGHRLGCRDRLIAAGR